MHSSLVNASMVLGSIDDRLMECGVSRRSYLKFCSALMVAALRARRIIVALSWSLYNHLPASEQQEIIRNARPLPVSAGLWR
jgi:hypothetical protein